jgi:hypothetical protein
MQTTNLIKTAAWFSLIGAAGLLIWWFLMPVFLPVSNAGTDFQDMILDPDWTPLNLAGLVSTLFITLGFPAFSFYKRPHPDRPGSAGLVVAFTGLILFTGIQYYETLLWPAAASADPGLVGVTGALVSGDTGVAAGLLVSGILLGAGYILFGISALRAGTLPKTPLWFLIFGAPVFANGIIFPARTLGLLLFCAGTIWLALKLRKHSNT